MSLFSLLPLTDGMLHAKYKDRFLFVRFPLWHLIQLPSSMRDACGLVIGTFSWAMEVVNSKPLRFM